MQVGLRGTDQMRQLAMKGTAFGLLLALILYLTPYRSGRKIIEILKKNPEKDPEDYDEEDLGHMRKVVSVRLFNPVYAVSVLSFVNCYKVLQASSRTGREGKTRYK